MDVFARIARCPRCPRGKASSAACLGASHEPQRPPARSLLGLLCGPSCGRPDLRRPAAAAALLNVRAASEAVCLLWQTAGACCRVPGARGRGLHSAPPPPSGRPRPGAAWPELHSRRRAPPAGLAPQPQPPWGAGHARGAPQQLRHGPQAALGARIRGAQRSLLLRPPLPLSPLPAALTHRPLRPRAQLPAVAARLRAPLRRAAAAAARGSPSSERLAAPLLQLLLSNAAHT